MMRDFLLHSSMKHYYYYHHHHHYGVFCFCEELTVGTGSVYVKCVKLSPVF